MKTFRKLFNILFVICFLFLIPTFVYATETPEEDDEEYILGVDENGNPILIETPDDIIVNPDDTTNDNTQDGSINIEITEDLENPNNQDNPNDSDDGFSIEIQEDINKENENQSNINIGEITPIVGELDQEVEKPTGDLNTNQGLSPIVILGIIAGIITVIIVLIVCLKRKR